MNTRSCTKRFILIAFLVLACIAATAGRSPAQAPGTPEASFIWGVGVQLGAAHANAYLDQKATLTTALNYAIENARASTCMNADPIIQILNKVQAGATAKSVFPDLVNLLSPSGRNSLNLDKCLCVSKTAYTSSVQGAYNSESSLIWGAGVQLGAAHADAFYDQRDTLVSALRYAIDNARSSSCMNADPISQILNKVQGGAAAKSVFPELVNLMSPSGRASLNFDRCICSQGCGAPLMPAMLLETIDVPNDKPVKVKSSAVLQKGKCYTIEASGEVSDWYERKTGVDPVWCYWADRCGKDGKPWNQLRVNDKGFDDIAGKPIPYNPRHVYHVRMPGTGKQVEFYAIDAQGSWTDNYGAFTVRIYEE